LPITAEVTMKREVQYAEHVRYGRGEIIEVRELDSGGFVAVVRFPDESEKTLRLDPRYWTSDITSLKPAAPAKRAKKVAA
jgi:hypothetical protein